MLGLVDEAFPRGCRISPEWLLFKPVIYLSGFMGCLQSMVCVRAATSRLKMDVNRVVYPACTNNADLFKGDISPLIYYK